MNFISQGVPYRELFEGFNDWGVRYYTYEMLRGPYVTLLNRHTHTDPGSVADLSEWYSASEPHRTSLSTLSVYQRWNMHTRKGSSTETSNRSTSCTTATH